MNTDSLHIKTPLIASAPLSRKVKGSVWLKVEALQPTGSFKLRGIGRACRRYASEGAHRFISSSGGNAGIAVAYAGKKLGVAVTVVVPHSTPQRSIELIRRESAKVVVHGRTWQESHEYALGLLDACLRFAEDHRLLVEPACGASLAAVYEPVAELSIKNIILVIICGGAGVTIQQLLAWDRQLNEHRR